MNEDIHQRNNALFSLLIPLRYWTWRRTCSPSPNLLTPGWKTSAPPPSLLPVVPPSLRSILHAPSFASQVRKIRIRNQVGWGRHGLSLQWAAQGWEWRHVFNLCRIKIIRAWFEKVGTRREKNLMSGQVEFKKKGNSQREELCWASGVERELGRSFMVSSASLSLLLLFPSWVN